jgi:hypothetical protein
MTRKSFDATVFVVFLTFGAMAGLRIAAKRRVVEGQTSGITGAAAQAAVVAF